MLGFIFVLFRSFSTRNLFVYIEVPGAIGQQNGQGAKMTKLWRVNEGLGLIYRDKYVASI